MRSVLISILAMLRGVVRSRAVLHLEILALRHQVQVLQRSRPRRLHLRRTDRWLWVGCHVRGAAGERPSSSSSQKRLSPGIARDSACSPSSSARLPAAYASSRSPACVYSNSSNERAGSSFGCRRRGRSARIRAFTRSWSDSVWWNTGKSTGRRTVARWMKASSPASDSMGQTSPASIALSVLVVVAATDGVDQLGRNLRQQRPAVSYWRCGIRTARSSARVESHHQPVVAPSPSAEDDHVLLGVEWASKQLPGLASAERGWSRWSARGGAPGLSYTAALIAPGRFRWLIREAA